MENFSSTLKIELVHRSSWRTRDDAENAIFAYIDGWYNPERIHKDLDRLSPDEYEAAWHAKNIDTPDPANTTLEQAIACQPPDVPRVSRSRFGRFRRLPEPSKDSHVRTRWG
ncbi:IS3 family transposase [Catellatospora sp. NPDC049609]|uniref:IS3 family transposase n=1 Tax=Catellatospora sp. NPDC049609 TaxID=3155505 RepID=UPI00344220DC